MLPNAAVASPLATAGYVAYPWLASSRLEVIAADSQTLQIKRNTFSSLISAAMRLIAYAACRFVHL